MSASGKPCPILVRVSRDSVANGSITDVTSRIDLELYVGIPSSSVLR
jgi:hypothetical protein